METGRKGQAAKAGWRGGSRAERAEGKGEEGKRQGGGGRNRTDYRGDVVPAGRSGGLGGEGAEGGWAGAGCPQGGQGLNGGGREKGRDGSQSRGEEGQRRERQKRSPEKIPISRTTRKAARTPARSERELRDPGRRGGGESPAAAPRPPAALTCSAQLRARTAPGAACRAPACC